MPDTGLFKKQGPKLRGSKEKTNGKQDHFRIAIVGIGAVARMHAVAISEIPNATLVAASCRTETKGREFTEEFGCAWYDDYEIMISESRPDIACICTPSGTHLEVTQACARRGVHVLCEKPIEISSVRARKMITAARKAHIALGGIFPQRYNHVMNVVHDAVTRNRFGHIAAINCYVPWWRDDHYYAPNRWQGTREMDGGGAIINQSIHMIDMLQWIASANMPYLARGVNPVEEVFAFTACRGHDPGLIDVEDTAVAVLRFRSGALGQILGATSMYPGSHRRLQIAGRDGTAEVAEDQLVGWQFRDELPEDIDIRERFSAQAKEHGGGSDPMAFSHQNHKRNILHFLEALEDDIQPELDGVESSKALEIVEAIYESAQTGKSVKVS